MRLTADRLPADPVTPPTGMEGVTLCRVSHQLAGEDCPGYTEHFKEGDEKPTEICPIHPGRVAHTDSAP